MKMKVKFEYKITLLYLILGSLWILFSDKVLYHFIPDGLKLTTVQTYKGWFFVLATSLLLFFFIKNYLTKNRKAEQELKNKKEEYYALFEEYKAQAEDLHVAKDKIEESLHSLKLVLENAPIPIFIQTDERFVFVNKALCEMYDAENEKQLLNQNVMERAHPDYLDYIKQRIHKLNNKRENVERSEYKHLKLSGESIDVEIQAVPFKYQGINGALVFIQDITAIKKYIKEIEQKNTFINTVLDNLPIGVALNKFNEGVATYINKKFEEIYGWPAADLKDIKSFFKKVYPDKAYREKIVNMITNDMETGRAENMHWEDIEITQKNGEKRIVNAVNIPLIEQNTMVSTVMDVTTQKQFEKELILAKEKSEESNRLKINFLNNISHEFRTPLNGMLGFLDLALQEDLSREQKKEYYKIIKESSRQFLNILTDVVEISQIQSKIDSHIITSCNLQQIIDKIIQDKKIQVDKKDIDLHLKINCNTEELVVQTDQHKLERSLIHVLDNAIKFTHKGNIVLSCTRAKDEIEIGIKDTGIGISKSDQLKIFEPFRQIETGETKSYGGNGIGLSLVKSYVESLGGKIALESELNKGTHVIIRIPAINNA